MKTQENLELAIEDGEVACKYCGVTGDYNISANDPMEDDEGNQILSAWCHECDREFEVSLKSS